MSLAVLADHMASKGRGPDSMLIHMSPNELQGLQALAMANGGSLTINPETGLPEAGFLDKLLPAIIGVGLSMAGVPPNVAAMMVGGAQTIRTGDIGKGISAGLGAYGGAGIGANMSAAGASSIGSQGAGLAGDMAFNLADAGSSFSNALPGEETGILNSSALSDEAAKGIQQQAADRVAATSPFDKISKGFDAVKANPMGYANADNFKYLGAAAAPILADQAVKSNLPQTTTRPGQIAPSEYDPYSGTFIRANPYAAQVKRAADGGVMGFDESSNSPMSRRSLNNMQDSGGMFNYAHDGGGVMKMAGGGVTDQQVVDWFKLNPGAKDTDIAAAMQQFNVDPTQVARATGTQDKLADYETRYQTATNQNVLAAADKFGPLSTATQGGTGTVGIADYMDKSGINAEEYARGLASRFGPASADSTTNPYTAQGIQALYDNAKMVGGQANIINAASPIKDVHDTRNDKVWVDWMDKNGIDVSEAARSFGLSTAEVQQRYLNAKKPPVKPLTYTRDGTGTGGPIESVINLPPGVGGGGRTVVNPNGTITTRPNIPGIPEGGFTGMTDVRDAYTKGGGSLGYTSPVPKSIEDFEKTYNTQTGGSKQAYDYLTGKTAYSPTPYTPTGEIMKPYFESVAGMPSNPSKKMYLFDPATKKYQINPDYAIPTYDKDGKKTYNLTNRDVSAYLANKPSGADFYTWAKTNNLSVEQIAAATGLPITEIQKLFSGGAPADSGSGGSSGNASSESSSGTGGNKAGGLMKMAQGGISGDGNLNLHIPLEFGGSGGGGGFGGTSSLFGGGIPGESTSTTGGAVNPNNAGGGFGFADRLDESGGLYKGTMQGVGGYDDMMTPDIMAANAATQAKNAAAQSYASANPASMSDLAKRLGIGMASGGIAALNMARGGMHQPFFSKSTGKFNFHPPQVYADGGMADHYNLGGYSDGGRLLRGPGDGVSDSIPATIGNKQPARLADGEFVVPARIVSELGNGSTEAGARKLYAMMDRVQAARKGSIGKGKVANNSRADKYLPV